MGMRKCHIIAISLQYDVTCQNVKQYLYYLQINPDAVVVLPVFLPPDRTPLYLFLDYENDRKD